ncbi:rCG28966, partial [Rattus norvegicus]
MANAGSNTNSFLFFFFLSALPRRSGWLAACGLWEGETRHGHCGSHRVFVVQGCQDKQEDGPSPLWTA